MSDYIHELNDGQRAAVAYNEGPSLVIAGAGSGKTRVLTYKIAYLLENGYQPWNILALTFTNKAAREMKERIAMLVGQERARYLWMGTFHSIFLRILHQEAEALGFSHQFTVYDASDSKSLVRSIIKEMQLDEKVYKPATIAAHISNAKNRLLTPDKCNFDGVGRGTAGSCSPATVSGIYHRYMQRCRQADAMDFDDLLLYTYILFRDHPQVLSKYQEQFLYVLVDEYQDTNYAQHQIVLQLGSAHQRVCVVGDDAQSIYSFRGAEIDNILTFTKAFSGARLFKLEQNYRSTQMIVDAANSLIKKNENQIRKDVFSTREVGEPIKVFQAYSDVEEGEMVMNKVAELHRTEHVPYSGFAILYRTNSQSRVFEEVMRKRGIPYRIYGGLSFYQRKEVKDVIAYFRLAVNPHDEEAFRRIINYPARGIGDTTVRKIAEAATTHRVSLWTAAADPAAYGVQINKGTAAKLEAFHTLMMGFISELADKNAYEAGTRIIRDSGILADISTGLDVEAMSRRENLDELVNGLNDFTQQHLEEGNSHVLLSDYLSEVSLLTDQDSDRDSNEPKVTLMTIHAAKGLEFDTVFVVGLEENLFPSAMSYDSPRAIEEERRLFYVAITRAERRCYLTHASTRFRYGKMEYGSPSRFLRDIDPKYVDDPQHMRATTKAEQWKPAPRPYAATQRNERQPAPWQTERRAHPTPTPMRNLRRITPAQPQAPGSAPSAGAGLQVGQHIQHERFGRGTVTRVEGTGENAKAHIHFEHAGDKQLLLRFARFTVID